MTPAMLSVEIFRLNRRLLQTAKQLAKSPSSPINEACGIWASTPGILNPHWEATAQRMAGCDGPVLVMQDTVFFSYGRHPRTRGLGPIGKSNASHERGLIMHNAPAFTTSGVPVITVADRESDFFEYLIGWTKDQRQRNLHLLVNNARFLILPWVHCKSLASRILALISRRLPDDWQHLADTQGRGKLDTLHQNAQPIKSIWIYPPVRNKA
jgi:hypothetical protein